MNNEEAKIPQEPVTPAPVPSEPQSSVPQMRTFSTDLAEELRKHQGSAMKIAMMESQRREEEERYSLEDPKKNMLLILGGIFAVLVALGIAIGVYVYERKQNTPVAPTQTVPASIIQSEDFTVLNIGGEKAEDITASIRAAVATSTTQTGMIESIYLTQGASSTQTRLPSSAFLAAINSHASKEFTQELSPNYMIGLYSYTQPNLFIALTGQQHDFLLAGMLQWEPFLFTDMAPIFGIDTTGDNAYLLNQPFTEMLIENHDVRAVLDHDGKPVLFYSFIDPDTIIITNDSNTLTETVRRLVQQ